MILALALIWAKTGLIEIGSIIMPVDPDSEYPFSNCRAPWRRVNEGGVSSLGALTHVSRGRGLERLVIFSWVSQGALGQPSIWAKTEQKKSLWEFKLHNGSKVCYFVHSCIPLSKSIRATQQGVTKYWANAFVSLGIRNLTEVQAVSALLVQCFFAGGAH